MDFPHLCTFIAAAGLLASTATAQSPTLYGSDVSLDQLMDIDPNSGSFTVIGSQGIPSQESVNGLAYDQVHDVLYGVNTATDELVTLNQSTGAVTTVGSTSGGQFNGLAYDPGADVLYSMTTADQLYQIDPLSGSSLFLGVASIPDQIEGMAMDGTTGKLYGLNGFGQIYDINTITGAATPLPNAIGLSGLWRGLTWDNANSQLLATIVGSGNGQLYAVDPVTGLGTFVGSTTNFAQGLAMTDGGLPSALVFPMPFLVAGTTANFSVSGATPFDTVYFLYSLHGNGPTNTFLGVLDLTVPIGVLSSLPADALGNATATIFIPAAASGRTLYTQAVTLPTGQISNSHAISVP